MAGGKRKHCQEREGDARHVRSRLSTGTQVTLPLRFQQTTIPQDDEPGGSNTPSVAEDEAKIQKSLANVSVSRNQKATKFDFLALIRHNTGLEPEDTLDKRFQPGYMADGEWICAKPAEWGRKCLDQLARIFAHATPDQLNEWLDERIKLRIKEQESLGTVAFKSDLAAFRRESSFRLQREHFAHFRDPANIDNFQATGKYYNFTNIAFAQPPLGDLRFAAPKSPSYIKGIQDGNDKINPTCAQAYPIWLAEASEQVSSVPRSTYETEDCLYLDVLVPEKVYQKRHDRAALAPVLVWIYGGGFVIGAKTQGEDGSGLIARSLENPDTQGIIFVALNYRLGAFGWLGGSDFEKQGGKSNAGILDQRLALEWIQENIAKFGGDPNRVTAMGESGGAASIGQHLVAGRNNQFDTCKTAFQQAIFQSPDEASPDFASDAVFNDRFHAFLKDLGVNNLQEAQALDFDKVYSVNNATVATYPSGFFTTFLFVKDGGYVQSNLQQGLAAGRYDHDVKIMTSHVADEGYLFTATLNLPPGAGNFSFPAVVKELLPSASQSDVDYISNDLYALSKFGNDEMNRTDAFQGEVQLLCNAYGLQKAFNNEEYAYRFSVPPAIHTSDIGYTLYNGHNDPTGTRNGTVAEDLQRYITQFVMTGDPNRSGLLPMPLSGPGADLLQFNVTGYDYVTELEIKERCEYWENYHW
ncbi:hypothetical protein PRZ48_006111 [Zasmidium cellare]|uniref:Carboxylesterase type B domain-containing protein n=1 Tax=Zasmidium cellare TaxID=395010 RepID=A0ABR0EMI4_ZASCE|nr:hypothetical protein PRZ48_006111 [Zasmidium cellare]